MTRTVYAGESGWLPALREIKLRIEEWFRTELQKVKYQSRVDDIQVSEKVRIFHHELHQKPEMAENSHDISHRENQPLS